MIITALASMRVAAYIARFTSAVQIDAWKLNGTSLAAAIAASRVSTDEMFMTGPNTSMVRTLVSAGASTSKVGA